MPKKKYFLTQAELAKLLKNYGGGYRWTHDKKLSQSGNVTYTDAQNNMLTINQLWDKDTDKPYVMVHISDSTGRIYRKDKWDWFETIRQLHFDWTLQGGQYDIEFKSIEGDKMAKKKRQSYTQELKAQIEEQKATILKQDEIITRMQVNGEASLLNSPTYAQMQEKIKFLEGCNKLSEIGRANAEGKVKRFSDSEKKLYEDNKAFLEHDGESDYFVGIIECYREINEVRRYKEECDSLEGKLKAHKDIIAEREKEIERLQGIIADLQQNQPATAPSEDMQRELDNAIWHRDYYKERYEREYDDYKKECDKSQKLAEEVEHLKLQLAEEPTTDHISDDELDSDVKYGEPWYVAYESKSKSELAKRLHFVETISQRRQRQIQELKKQVNDKKYGQYVQEDALTYNEALARADRAETIADQYLKYNKVAHEKNEELQRQLTELASASLTPEESMQIIEQNIKQSNELKKAARKKQGAPRRIDDRKVALMCELHKKGHSIREISKQVGCSVGSVHRLLNENKQ